MERVSNTEVLERDASAEQLKVFDEMASIRMLKHDLDEFGDIRQETWRQVYNEELTYVAESINAPLRTEFTLSGTSDGLVDERGVLLRDALQRGVWAAQEAARKDDRREFNLTRAIHDYYEAELLEEMMRSPDGHNTMVSVSPFCEEAYRRSGKQTVEDLGYQPERLLAFIRVYQKISGDRLKVISLSVDNSNLDAFRFVLSGLGVEVPAGTSSDDFLAHRAQLDLSKPAQEALPAKLIEGYDRALETMYGQEFRAGRSKQNETEAWGFIEQQKDLATHYFAKLEELAMNRPDDIAAKRKMTYAFWASLNKRLKNDAAGTAGLLPVPTTPELRYARLEQEMNQAFAAASRRHEKMTGCGGSISMTASKTLEESTPEEAMDSIMSDKKESWIWKSGICRVDNCPTRPGKTKVGPCDVCISCQHLFDKGSDPSKLYKKPIMRDNDKSKQKKVTLSL